METTERLAHFAAGTRRDDLPEPVRVAAKRAILDTLGVTLAGAREPVSQILLDYVGVPDAPGAASVLGTGQRTRPSLAALANGALGHALDFDDVSWHMRGHPSVAVLPAALALAERGGLEGSDFLVAFAVGFEVECRLGHALGPSSYASGWHATSVAGSPGAAAACANLLGLDAERTRHALGIAGSMACGSRQNFGTMTKPLHAGLAARAGVDAAELAARGFTADPGMLEAPLGFGPLFSPGGDWSPERLGKPGEPWELVDPGLAVKKYPCCHMTHRALDATLAASGGVRRDPADVEVVEVEVPAGSVPALIHPRPGCGLEGKFSMEYCVAAALLDGAVRLDSFEDASVRREEAQRLLRRVTLVEVPGEGAWSPGITRVTVHMKDGATLTAEVLRERGDPRDPLGDDELADKYRDCAGRVLGPEQVERSLELIGRLEEIRVEELVRTLTPAHP